MIDRKQIKNAVTFFVMSFLLMISILAICVVLATWIFSYKPSIYVKPGVNRTVLNIYAVLDKYEQEAILHQLVSAKQLVPDKPIRVIFMDKEVWTQMTESLSTRGAEKVIRTEDIE